MSYSSEIPNPSFCLCVWLAHRGPGNIIFLRSDFRARPLHGVGRELEEDPTVHARYQESRPHGFASPPVQSMTLVRVSTDGV